MTYSSYLRPLLGTTLILLLTSCSQRTTSTVHIQDEKIFGDLKTGLPERDSLIVIKNKNGQVIEEGHCAVYNGKPTHIRAGLWKEYYENGTVKSEGRYKVGRFVDCCISGHCYQYYSYRDGLWKYNDSTGVLLYELEFQTQTLEINTRCEGGDTLYYGLIGTIPLKYQEILTPDDVHELQKITVKDNDFNYTTIYTPRNGRLYIEQIYHE